MEKYLIGFAQVPLQEQEPIVVSAEGKGQAWEKGIREFVIKQEQFLSSVYVNTADSVFAEALWEDEEGPLLSSDGFREGLTQEEAWEIFEDNLNDFFRDAPDYANLYLRFTKDTVTSDWQEATEAWQFPEEMLADIYRRGGDWEHLQLHVIPLREME
ncbi:hypothetical protein [Pontibacter sp. SGAir0037]|uniref:hypothetical protein n=1 Tax=Pontibacter sp. SGAir0037 TaxID=2571030 RepID=UPI0010CD5BCA|nr:hypothetical protein [Pontibacter sp. SGAir0037]QCR24504.1 hypothetical protein C1N53_20510 [Pontibacter sp. SGAir0037]